MVVNSIKSKKDNRRSNALIFGSAAIFWILISVVATMFFISTREEAAAITKFEVGRFISSILEAGRKGHPFGRNDFSGEIISDEDNSGITGETESITQNSNPNFSFGRFFSSFKRNFREVIHGFGLYDLNGDPLYIYEEAPDHIDVQDSGDGINTARFIEDTQSLEIIQSLTISSFALGNNLSEQESFPEPDFAVVYLNTSTRPYWGRLRDSRLIFILVEVISFLIIFSFAFLIRKNEKYRRVLLDQEQLVVLGTAARTLAHEIKNPLASIRIQTSILRRKTETEERELDLIEEEVNRLRDLTDRIRDFLQNPEGEKRTIDIMNLLQEILKRKDLDWPITVNHDRWFISMDPQLATMVLENIISNAIESGSKGGEEITFFSSHKYVIMELRDKGKGLSLGEEELFQPFVSSKERGSGIGLALSKRFMNAVAGDIQLLNRNEGGCTAILRWPEVKVLEPDE